MHFFASPAALTAFNEKVIQIYFWVFFAFLLFFFFGMHFGQLNIFLRPLRWPEPIYMRDGYVFETRFSAGKI